MERRILVRYISPLIVNGSIEILIQANLNLEGNFLACYKFTFNGIYRHGRIYEGECKVINRNFTIKLSNAHILTFVITEEGSDQIMGTYKSMAN